MKVIEFKKYNRLVFENEEIHLMVRLLKKEMDQKKRTDPFFESEIQALATIQDKLRSFL